MQIQCDITASTADRWAHKMYRFGVASLCVMILAITLRESSAAGMTMAQVKQAMKMVRNVCQPKTGVSTEVLDGIQAGSFPDDKDLKCYMKCVMGMMQSLKNGKYKPDSAMAQAKIMLPDDLKDRVIASMEKCRNAGEGIEDNCEVAFAVTKCIYDADPEAFFFP